MAFWGCSFVFDGIPCEEFDLMLYDFGGNSQSEGKFASVVKIVEDKVSRKWKPFFYGTTFEDKLEFDLVFGVNQGRLDKGEYLDRFELEHVGSWLTGHNQYKWLEIIQSDLEHVRYRCIVTGLDIIEFGGLQWALKATIECDSPYAYTYPQTFEYDFLKNNEVNFFNESSHNGYYRPVLDISLRSSRELSIINKSDGDRCFRLTNIPTGVSRIIVDNEHCVLTTDDGINLYPCFNFNFLRLIRGNNRLAFEGDCVIRLNCEFPVNTGS